MTCDCQTSQNARRYDANRAVVSPLPRLVIATEKVKKKRLDLLTRVDLLGPRSLEYLFDQMTFLLTLY